MKPFQFSRIPRIIFRNGGLTALPDIIAASGREIILVTGKSSFIDSPGASALINVLETKGIGYGIIRIPSEPDPDMIDNAVTEFRDRNAALVVAIGGGSVIDAGKAISAMMNTEGSVEDYLEEVGTREHRGTKLPFIAVPTTSGTGSEATKNAVISRTGKNGFKKSLRHDNFVPDIALVDPELTLDCPPAITAASGMDCFTQLTEAWLSTKGNEYTDALAIEGIKTIKTSLLRSYIEGKDIEARSGMSFAALTSGICLANAGLGVVHGFASSIGGTYNIPHGLVCGTLMAVSNEITVRKLRATGSNPGALKKYATLGRIFIDEDNRNDDFYITGFISYLHYLTSKLQLPGLKSQGLEENSIEEICNVTGSKNNPVALDKDELMEIVSRRLI
jgi:alcohol dehydrogenase class IV